MQLLKALNQLLLAAGESEVETIDAAHPLQQLALSKLDDVSALEQSNGWWFNQYDATLTPNADGHLLVPVDAIKVQTKANRDWPLIMRGGKLMDKNTRSVVFDQPIQATITEVWPFEELPQTFAQYVAALAAMSLASSVDADAVKLQTLAQVVSMARTPMHKEHVQNSHVNMLETPSMFRHTGPMRGLRYNQ